MEKWKKEVSIFVLSRMSKAASITSQNSQWPRALGLTLDVEEEACGWRPDGSPLLRPWPTFLRLPEYFYPRESSWPLAGRKRGIWVFPAVLPRAAQCWPAWSWPGHLHRGTQVSWVWSCRRLEHPLKVGEISIKDLSASFIHLSTQFKYPQPSACVQFIT